MSSRARHALFPTRTASSFRRPPSLWKVVVSEDGDIWVRGVSRGSYKVIAAAKWNAAALQDKLLDQRQLDPQNPTGFQWNLIADSVANVLAHAERAHEQASTSGPGATDKIERPSDAELAALVPTDEANAEMQKNLRGNQDAAASATATVRRRRQGLWIGFSVSAVVIVLVATPIVCVVLGRGKDKVAVPTLPNGDPVVVAIDAAEAVSLLPPDAPIDASSEEAVMTAESLPSAIALSKAAFTASTSNDVSAGALRLAHFNHMQWSDVDVPAETTLPLIEKDAEAELGKRVCVEGQILTIRRRDLEQAPRPPKKMFVGRLRATKDDDVAFVAVGSTGSLVKLDKARFCGVSTGMSGSIPELVGMFDLPETHQPQVEQ